VSKIEIKILDDCTPVVNTLFPSLTQT